MPRKRKTPKYGLDDAPSSIDKKKAKVYTVAEAADMVIINKLHLDEALRACNLHNNISPQLLHYYVQKNRKLASERRALGIVIECPDIDDEDGTETTSTSPLTEPSSGAEAKVGGVASRAGVDNEDNAPAAWSGISSITGVASSSSFSSSFLERKTRKSSKQKTHANLVAKEESAEYYNRFKAAFKEGTIAVAAKRVKKTKSGESVPSIATRLNRKYGLLYQKGKRKLTRTTLHRAVQNGRIGVSPCKRGPASKIPDLLIDLTATHSEVSQVGNGGELRGKDFKMVMGAAVLGTQYEGKFEMESAWRKLRKTHPEKLQAANVATGEDARLRWTTYNNLQKWFDDAKLDLIASGLVSHNAVVNERGELISEVDFGSPQRGGDDVKRRILNMDETHHDLSITTEKGGPRSTMYHNPHLQRGYKRTVKAGRHVTGVYATNAAGEVLPPMYIFDSAATIDANYRVRVSWLDGLPNVEGRFGCPSRVQSGSFVSVRSSGSMDDSLFNDYIEQVVLPLYPNISKTVKFHPETGRLLCGPVILKVDAGPGRMVASDESITKRAELAEKGLLILLGLPNATSVQQEMDVMYQGFKAATYARGETLLTRKLMLRGREIEEHRRINRNGATGAAVASTPLSIGFEDLSIVVNGYDDDPIDMKPFDKFFTKERIVSSWERVGFVPFTRNCLKHKKVRHEIGEQGEAKSAELEDLQDQYDHLVSLARRRGFNAGVFDASIPVAKRMERVVDEEEQVKQLLETKSAFSASGIWNICGTRIANANVVLRAQKQQVALEAEKSAVQAQGRAARRVKLLVNAQTALQKYRDGGNNGMTDKDWGDIIRWVLPESKAEGLMKDLKKSDAIIAKLATLDREWTTYIPPIEAV